MEFGGGGWPGGVGGVFLLNNGNVLQVVSVAKHMNGVNTGGVAF